MSGEEKRKDVDIDKKSVNREENPSLIGSTFIKYAAYIIILIIILYFVVNYIFPKF